MLRSLSAIALIASTTGCGGTQDAHSSEPERTEPAANTPAETAVERDAATEAPVAAQEDTTTDTPADAEDIAVEAGAISLTAPGTWKRKAPQSGFVAAEFALPRSEGDQRDGRLTVSIAGGTVKLNVDRWRGQFAGKPKNESQDEETIAGATVTIVDFSGTFNDRRGPFAPGQIYEGYRMIGAIIPAKGRLHFVKAYGPEKTIGQQRDKIIAFVRSLKINE